MAMMPAESVGQQVLFLRSLVLNQGEHIEREKARRRTPVVGYLCSYTPVELLRAAGTWPVRLNPGPRSIGHADAHIQSFACSFARGVVEALFDGSLDYLDGIVFPYTCDSLRAAAEIWQAERPGLFFHFLNLPLRMDGRAAAAFLREEFEHLGRRLAEAFRDPAPALAGELGRQRTMDGMYRALWARRGSSAYSAGDFLALAWARESLPLEEATALVQRLLMEDGGASHGGRPVLVAGGAVEDPAVLDDLERCGLRVVADDLCTGSRAFAYQATTCPDPWEALVRKYLDRVHCPTKHPAEGRIEHLLRQVEASGATAVIFLLQKYCESHAFDYPHLVDVLRQAGVPCMMVEIEQGSTFGGQTATRVQAFLETAGGEVV